MNIGNLFTLCNYLEGEEGSDGGDVTVVTETDNVTEVTPDHVSDSIETYLGSKEINPEQKPLKSFDRKMLGTKDGIDSFLKSMQDHGEDIFLPAQPEQKAKSKKEPVKGSDKKPITKEKGDGLHDEGDKGSKGDKGDKGSKGDKGDKGFEEVEVDVEKFVEDLGLTIDEFQALPEKVQEKLVAEESPTDVYEQRYTKLSEEHTGLLNDVVKLKNDPVIAARIEEFNSGKMYVARDIPPVSSKEADSLLTLADNKDEFVQAINELITAKAKEVLTIERGVLDRNTKKRERETKAAQVLQDVINKEARIGITEKDITKIADESHPEYDKLFGAGSLMEMLKRKKYSPAQIIEKGADEILEEYAKTKGWDKERISKIVKKEKQSLLAKLRDFKKVARTLDIGKKSIVPDTSVSNQGFDKQSLIAEIASGKTATWSKLLSQYGDQGDQGMIAQLNDIYEKGMSQRRG